MSLPCPNCRRVMPASAPWCPTCGALTDRRGATTSRVVAVVGVVACVALALSVLAVSLALR